MGTLFLKKEIVFYEIFNDCVVERAINRFVDRASGGSRYRLFGIKEKHPETYIDG
jgi:hypothetical protein